MTTAYTDIPIPRKLWEPVDPQATQMYKFQKHLERDVGRQFKDYFEMYDYSCAQRAKFWRSSFDYFPIIYGGKVPDVPIDEKARMDSTPRWFQGVKINFAENCLFIGDKNGNPTTLGKEDNKIAVTEVREGSFLEPIVHITWKELRERVGQLSQAMRARGVRKGDRVALVASVCIDSLVVYLATTSLGAIFSSSSTDMGIKGIMDRLIQIRPKFLFMDDFAIYNGKRVDLRAKMKDIAAEIKPVTEFEGIIAQARFKDHPVDISSVPGCETWASFVSVAKSTDLVFERVDFWEPFLIVYSSGTTGQAKCIVHSTGGVILNGNKECRLHRDMDENSTQLQYTTTGWIMYTQSVLGLLAGCRVVTYDGSPFLPDIRNFIRMLGEQKVTSFGTSPRYLQELVTNNIRPREIADLSNLKNVVTTGMVLSDALFEWFYDVGFPTTAHLDNISGGTDLVAGFGLGNPMIPVYSGGCQCFALGYSVEVYDSEIEGGRGVKGRPVGHGVPGELVSTAAFPTMPVMFWADPDGQRYFNSYFARFDGVWTHGDFIMVHPVTRQVLFLGRADGVLNPSGVRFGSAEIYNVIDTKFKEQITDSICVGQRRPQDDDERVVLFLLMKPGHKFNQKLVRQIKDAIRKEMSPRHVPKFVFETPDIPCTVNGKKVELPVKQILCGKTIKPSGTLLNPQSLDYFYRFAKDENLVEEPQAKL